MLVSSCRTTGEGAWTGAHVGSMVGGAFGGLVGGHRGYHAGQLVGMATGAATGATIGAANQAARKERVKGYHRRMKQRIAAEEAANRNRRERTHYNDQRTATDDVYAPAGRVRIGNGISIETNDTIRRYRSVTPQGGSYTPQQDAPVIDETNSSNDIIVFE